MNTDTPKKADTRYPRYQWLFEVLIFASLTPALVYGIMSIDNVPLLT